MAMAAPPKPPRMQMQGSSVASDGSIHSEEGAAHLEISETDVSGGQQAESARSLYEGTQVQELDTNSWAAVEARADTKTAFAVNFYTPGNSADEEASAHFIEWTARLEYKIKVAAVNCARQKKLCSDQKDAFGRSLVQKNPQLILYTPYDEMNAAPEIYKDRFDTVEMVQWARVKLHKLRDEKNRRAALTLIRRDNAQVYEVGDENEKVACFLHAARNAATVLSVKSYQQARDEGLEDHPIKDLWGFPADVENIATREFSGNCKEVATILQDVMDRDGTNFAFAEAYKTLVLRAFELMDSKERRWEGNDPYPYMMIHERVAPSLLGMKVLRLCVGIGDEAPMEIWVHCLGREGVEVTSQAKQTKEEL